MQPRSIKLDRLGDWWRKRVFPGLRLRGQWMARAGFTPGARVRVRVVNPGVLLIEQEVFDQAAADNNTPLELAL